MSKFCHAPRWRDVYGTLLTFRRLDTLPLRPSRSRRTCRVEGHVTIVLVDANGEDVDLPTEEVDEPGPAEPITPD